MNHPESRYFGASDSRAAQVKGGVEGEKEREDGGERKEICLGDRDAGYIYACESAKDLPRSSDVAANSLERVTAVAVGLLGDKDTGKVMLGGVETAGQGIGGKRIRKTCVACSRAKVKCSSTYPKCSRCAQHDRVCEYVEEKKRGRKTLSPSIKTNESSTKPSFMLSYLPSALATSLAPYSLPMIQSSPNQHLQGIHKSHREAMFPSNLQLSVHEAHEKKYPAYSQQVISRPEAYNPLDALLVLQSFTTNPESKHNSTRVNIEASNEVVPSFEELHSQLLISSDISLSRNDSTGDIRHEKMITMEQNNSPSEWEMSQKMLAFRTVGERIFTIFFILFKHLSTTNPHCPCHDQNGAFSGSPYILNLNRMGKFLQIDALQISPGRSNASINLDLMQSIKNREAYVTKNMIQNYEKFIGSPGPRTDEILGILQTGILHDITGIRVYGNPDFANNYGLALSEDIPTIRIQVSVSDTPLITSNALFTSTFGYSQADLVFFFTDSLSGGLLPWGTDLMALMMDNAEEVLEFIHHISVSFNRIDRMLPAYFREGWVESIYQLRGVNGFNQPCKTRFVVRELVSFGGTAFEALFQAIPMHSENLSSSSDVREIYPNYSQPYS